MRRERFLPLAVKFTLLFTVFALAICSLVSVLTYRTYTRSMLERYGEHGVGVASIAASILDGDQVLEWADTQEPDAAYFDLLDQLVRIKENGGVTFLYVQVPLSEDEFVFVFDATHYTMEVHGAPYALGMRGSYDGYYSAIQAMETGMPTRDMEITKSDYGYLASVFVPIFDGQGRAVGYVGADLSMDEIIDNLHSYILRLGLITLAVVVAGFVLLLALVRRSVVQPVVRISQAASQFTQNIHDESFGDIQIHSGDELGTLARSVNGMFRDIRSYTVSLAEETAQRERIQKDLETARHIQQEVLPRSFPPDPGCPYASIYASMKPAKWVGGDFYDFFRIDDDRVAVVVGDVSGKGIPAALFMMIVRTMIKNQALTGAPLDAVFRSVNDQLCQDNDAGMFVTAFLGVYSRSEGVLRWVNAGHNPPLLLRRDGSTDWLEVTPNFVLAGMDGMDFAAQQCILEPGDSLLLYTDGVTEAADPEEALFGDHRLWDTVVDNRLHRLDPKEAVETVAREVERFSAGAEQADDITLLLLRVLE